MRTLKNQRGMGLLGMLAIAVMVGFFVMSGIKIMPGYMEYLSIYDTVARVAEEYDDDEDTISDIRRKLADYFNTNQIRRIHYRDVDITRRDGEVFINANFEDRIPLVWRIDAVVRYDDLEFMAGERRDD
mgnify:CR=1 FL=1